MLICEIKTFTFDTHFYSHLYAFSQTFLSLITPFRQLTNQPWAKALATAHEFIFILTFGHFFFYIKQIRGYTVGSSAHWEDFPSLLSPRTTPKWNYNAAVIHFRLIQYTSTIHTWTKLSTFLPPLTWSRESHVAMDLSWGSNNSATIGMC